MRERWLLRRQDSCAQFAWFPAFASAYAQRLVQSGRLTSGPARVAMQSGRPFNAACEVAKSMGRPNRRGGNTLRILFDRARENAGQPSF